MSDWDTARLITADKKHVWHPFTDMREWCAPDHEPLVLVGGQGAMLRDSRGGEYIDGNSSIWTNIHGHNHPHINAAIREQLDRVAHTSFLGFTNPPAIKLAEKLVKLFPGGGLNRVFYSDDGSTGIEAALRIVSQYWQLRGSPRNRFISFRHGYHGDTAGAASLGAGDMFGLPRWGLPVTQYDCIEQLKPLSPHETQLIAAVVIEPIVQGAAGMKLWREGLLREIRRWCDGTGALLIADEVMTGFGRTGKMFACEHEAVQPDIIVLGKALTGGYLPLACTLITEEIFTAFVEAEATAGTLFYGHSYTGNALGCAAALANLEIFERESTLDLLPMKIALLERLLSPARECRATSEIRQCGFIAAIDLESAHVAAEVCKRARQYGLLTRPIRNVVVLMPPYCITDQQLTDAVNAIRRSIDDVCGTRDAG
jgi:adenosylmethionine-8-amino-7-oxononanoate aminotransferase